MSAAWMVYALAVAALCFGGALAAEYVARVFARPTRFVWLIALGAATAIPIASLVRPRVLESTTIAPAPPRVSTSIPAHSAAPDVEATTPASTRNPLSAVPATLGRAMSILSIGSPALAMAFLLVAFVRMRRLARTLDEGTLDGHPVLLSQHFGPALLGVVHARVVIPRWLLALPESDRRIVLSHERAHAEARDPVVLAIATGLLVLQPWNLLAWLLVARLRLAIETDCDERVLHVHGDARRYSRLLLTVHERGATGRVPRMAFVHRRTNLERRVRRLMERRPSRSAARNVAAVAATVLVTAVACEMPAPTARGGDTAASGPSFAYSVLGVQPPCMSNFFERDPVVRLNRIRKAARERRPEAEARSRESRIVVGLVLDENCNVTRDTLFVQPPDVFGEKLFGTAFPDITSAEHRVGLVWEGTPTPAASLTIVYGVVPSPALAARRARDECGFGIRFEEVCVSSGPVVIRMMDSVRALVAVRKFYAANKPADHVFLVTLSRPNPALTSQTLQHGIVTYQSGALEINDFLTRDPPYVIAARDPAFLFDPSKAHWMPIQVPPRQFRRINQLVGVAHYGSGWLTLEQIESLRPTRKCEGAPGACYEVGGRVIEFPS